MSTAGFPTTVASFGLIATEDLKVERIAREVEAVQAYAKAGLNPKGVIDLSTSFILATGAPMAVFSNGASAVPGTEFNNSKGYGIRWNNNATLDAIITGFVVPNDADVATAMTIYVRAAKTGATAGDLPTFAIEAYNQVTGALCDADANYGRTTSAMTNAATKTLQVVSATLGASDLPAVGSGVTIKLKPTDGTLGTDDLTVFNVWIEYTKLHA